MDIIPGQVWRVKDDADSAFSKWGPWILVTGCPRGVWPYRFVHRPGGLRNAATRAFFDGNYDFIGWDKKLTLYSGCHKDGYALKPTLHDNLWVCSNCGEKFRFVETGEVDGD